MRDERPRSSERLRRMAIDYEASVSQARAEQLAARSVARGTASVPPHRRLVAAMGAFSLLLFTASALGFVSDGALPGDPLYPVDRAYEAFGSFIGVVDPLEERLEEAIALADRGDRARAALVAAEALEEFGRKSGVTLLLPQTESTTTTALEDASSTTPSTSSSTTRATAAIQEQEATPTTVVEAEDPVEALRLAADALLRSVRSAKDDPGAADEVDRAAADLALAVSSMDPDEEESEGDTGADSAVQTEETTETTETDRPGRGRGTSTTSASTEDAESDPSDSSSTTTSSLPEDEGVEPGEDGVTDTTDTTGSTETTDTTAAVAPTPTTVIILPPLP